ncbi:hypothetical protein P152DRAFT_458034 [Eremomyces bilateralis CBS 781.70]|uniref:Chaperone DnaJ C-terminal domain-containing protein n=1 Tax=Eremomyces bilateralis CBS 781.70 TaxID=1392243 RepID=A0A6G1G4K6_9PEZI|nr:uncharacterized protein P152DRAFT_458034 [Eremomyces bilateralis CBS 781.70]KAF1812846.1 hypothetical protein P152DRAFT_458034 [Eremomyces bilateralis CBS 781.70]
MTETFQPVGPGLVTRAMKTCGTCNGDGKVFKEKEKCRKCKGKKVVEARKTLELYIPPGSRQGESIPLKGEADQVPGQEPGDIIFHLVEVPHDTFRRAGADLAADIHISLSEALTGFGRVVLTHLDGRGIQIQVDQPAGRVLKPDQVLKVKGEGMPIKRSEGRGDLFLVLKIDFPEDGWLKDAAAIRAVRDVLPKPKPAMASDNVDEVQWEDGDMDDYGAGSGDQEWEDDDEEGGPQCATQ